MLNILTNISFIILNLSKNGSVQKFGIGMIEFFLKKQHISDFSFIAINCAVKKNFWIRHFSNSLSFSKSL